MAIYNKTIPPFEGPVVPLGVCVGRLGPVPLDLGVLVRVPQRRAGEGTIVTPFGAAAPPPPFSLPLLFCGSPPPPPSMF